MDNYVEKEFHIYDSIVTLPTCSSKGYTTHICKNCSDSYIDSYVDELQHKFAADIILPSCKEEGYTLYTCDCGYKYIESENGYGIIFFNRFSDYGGEI